MTRILRTTRDSALALGLAFGLSVAPSGLLRAADVPAAAPASVEAGRNVYLRQCTPCHARGGAGAVLLGRRLGDAQSLLDRRDDLAPVYIRHVVRNGLGGMPWLTPIELPERELDALVAFLTRNQPANAKP
jgi:mono/diheme cytochrome c family protein